MKLPNIGGLFTVGKTVLAAHRPEILFGASVVATVGATVLAAKGGYEARGIVDAAQEKSETPLTHKEMANLTWHCYTPAALTCISAVGATTGLHWVHVNEKKALATAGLAAIDEIKREAKEYIAQADDVIDPDRDGKTVVETRLDEGDPIVDEMYLIRDGRTGRDFWSNKRIIEEAIIECKNVIAGGGGAEGEGDCDLSYFYNQAGIKSTPDAYKLGWSGVLPEVKWKEALREDGRAVNVFTFQPEPALELSRA